VRAKGPLAYEDVEFFEITSRNFPGGQLLGSHNCGRRAFIYLFIYLFTLCLVVQGPVDICGFACRSELG